MEKEQALEFLCRVAEGIAETFGNSCEALIQDMSQKNHPIFAIYHGHVTGRQVGSKEDVYGAVSEEETILDLKHDLVNHLVISKKGRRIKSSTFLLKGEDYHYALGVNFDFTELYQAVKIQEDLLHVRSDLEKAVTEEVQGSLQEIFDGCEELMGKSAKTMNKAERLRLVKLLKEKNAFEFYKAVPYISNRMGVTRYTVYNYLNQLEP